jgi:CRISPR-associated protein Cas2
MPCHPPSAIRHLPFAICHLPSAISQRSNMADEAFYLVTYDIPDDRRRTKLYDRLLDFGSPVQYSVFECLVDEKQLAAMRKMIGRTISKQRDHVRIYRLCEACRGRIWVSDGSEAAHAETSHVV